MKWTGILATTALMTLATTALADVPPPPERREEGRSARGAYELVLLPAPDGKAVVELPRKLIGRTGDKTSEGTPLRTALAGVFLSLGLVSGGVWVARRKGSPALSTAVLVGAGLAAGAAGTAAWANLAPPRRPKAMQVTVRQGPEGQIRLYISPDQLQTLTTDYTDRSTRFVPAQPRTGSAPPSGSAPSAAPK